MASEQVAVEEYQNAKFVTLSEICLAIIDCSHARKPSFLKEGEYIFLEANNIGEDGKLDLTEVDYVSEEDYSAWTKRLTPQKNDIIITKTGRVGAVAIIPDGIKCCIGRNQVILRPNTDKILPRYLLYYMLSPQFRKEIQRLALSGTILESLHVKYVPQLRVNLYSLKIQQRIVDLLYPLYSKIELSQSINETLEQIGQTIFKSWFIDFEPFKDGEFVDSELGKIPKGWEVEKLKDVVKNIISGRGRYAIESTSGTYPLWGANGVIGYVNKYDLEDYVILTGRVGTLGEIFLTNEKVAISDNVLAMIPKEKSHTFLIYLWAKKQIDFESLNVGSSQPLITKTTLGNEEVLLPPPLILEKFHLLIEPLFQKIILNQKQTMVLKKVRDTLLPLLVFGKLRVEEI